MDNAIAADDIVEISPTWRRVTDLVDLVEIFDPAVQVCTWKRDIDPAITTYLASLDHSGMQQTLETLSATDEPRLDNLPEGSGRTALRKDIAFLREILCELLGCQAVGLRVARLRHAMCPGWHLDQTGMRLVCTYQGPGTQWLEQQGIDVSNLGHGTNGNRHCIEATPGEIVLLKGNRWQDNERFGAIHRSPEPTADAAVRTLVTLDPLWRT
ncbi:MAG: DUF1826 domain-containing protein [Chromatiales bacterium]|jgi:hypothetical protein